VPVGPAKFDLNRCNESPCEAKNVIFSVSKFSTGSLPLCGNPTGKNHMRGTVICSTEYEQSDCESTKRSFQSVRSYEEIRGTFDSKGGRRPQRLISTTVNGDCSTSHLR